MLSITHRQEKASRRHKEFQQDIARRASQVKQVEDRSYSIPNTPFGVPKVAPDKLVQILRVVAPAYSYCWCYDLVRFGEIYIATGYVPNNRTQIRDIQEAVAEFYSVRVDDILSARRTLAIVRPRQIAAYLSKTLTGKSLPEIGRRFGDRDHTTILSSVRRIEALMQSDEELRADLRTIADKLGRRLP